MPTPDDLPLNRALEEATEDLPDAAQLTPQNAGGSANPNRLEEEDLDRHTATEMSVTSLFCNLFTDGREIGMAEREVSL